MVSQAPTHDRAPAPANADFVPLAPAHRDALARLFARNAGTEGFDPFPLTRAQASQLARSSGADRYFVAIAAGEILGLTMLRGWDEGYEVPSFGILIDHAHRGLGLGRRMTELTLAEARALGCRTVRLSVYGSNSVARALYARLGFVEQERAAHRVAGRSDVRIVMSLDLERRPGLG